MDLHTKDETKKLIVSDLFVEIYKNFNVVSQIENVNKLSRKEMFLLLILCLDKHSDEDSTVLHNFMPFQKECMLIYDLQDDKVVDDVDLLYLIEESGDKYVETDFIVDKNGDKLPDPLSKIEVRDAKINIINNEN